MGTNQKHTWFIGKENKMKATNFRKEIMDLMKEKNVTTAQLYRACNLNPATVYNYLNGTSDILSHNLESMFDVLKAL